VGRRGGLSADYPRVCAAHVFVYYFLDVSPTDARHGLEYVREKVAPPPPGTILLWDPVYSLYNSDHRRSIPLEELLEAGWVKSTSGEAFAAEGWHVLVSRPVNAATAPAAPHPPRR